MMPVLQVGPLAIQTYPLALLVAAWLALAVGARVARKLGLDGDHVYNMGLYALVGGLLAARLAHVITYWSAYRTQPLEIFGFNTQAFLPWPGLITGMAVAGWYVHRRRLPAAAVLDALGPGLLIGAAIASLGALLAGRTPGAETNLPWAVSLWSVKRHPNQIYEALAALAVAAAALRIVWQGSKPGAAALVALAGYGLSRWLLEPFRAETTTLLGGLRLGQVVGLLLAVASLWALSKLTGRPDRSGPASDAT